MSPLRAVDGELDGLLDEWAATSRLTAAEAEAVRAAVVAERPEGLDARWWSALVGQVSAAVIQTTAQVSASVIEATAFPDSARFALGRPAWSAGLQPSA